MIYECNDPIIVCFCKYCYGLFNYFTLLLANLVELKLQAPSSESQFPAEISFISLSLVRYFEFTLFIYNSTIAVYLLKAYEQNIEFCLCSSVFSLYIYQFPAALMSSDHVSLVPQQKLSVSFLSSVCSCKYGFESTSVLEAINWNTPCIGCFLSR